MMIIAMWCRHEGDNLIGIGSEIPWQIESDSQKFRDVVKGQVVVCGRKTYESFPNRQLDCLKMFIMTSQADYEVEDKYKHVIFSSQKKLADMEIDEDLYLAGGAEVYDLFMSGKECFKPQIIVDCVYDGDMNDISGKEININKSVEIMKNKYRKITPNYRLDGVDSAIWIKKGDFVEQSVLKRLIGILERDAEIVY